MLLEEAFFNCSHCMAWPLSEFCFCGESVLFSCILRPEELLERTRDQTTSDYGLYNQIFMMYVSFLTMITLFSYCVFFSCHVL